MDDKLSEYLYSDIWNIVFFAFAVLVIASIAYVKGFFRLPKYSKKEKNPVNFIDLLVSFGIYIGISVFVGAFITKHFSFFLTKENSIAFVSWFNLILNLLIFAGLALFFTQYRTSSLSHIIKREYRAEFTYLYDAKIGFLSWFLAFPLVLLTSQIIDLLLLVLFNIKETPDQLAINYLKLVHNHPFYFGIAIIVIVILAPVIEEFLFRGVLYNFLKNYFRRRYAIIINSLIFAFFHFSIAQSYANFNIVISLFVLACFLNYLYERQQSLIAPIVLHATFNIFSIINLVYIKGIK